MSAQPIERGPTVGPYDDEFEEERVEADYQADLEFETLNANDPLLTITPEQAQPIEWGPVEAITGLTRRERERVIELDAVHRDLQEEYARAYRSGAELIRDVDYIVEPDGSATISVELAPDATDQEREIVRDGVQDFVENLEPLIEDLKQKAAALKRQQLHDLRSKQATLQPRDDKGKFRKLADYEANVTYNPPQLAHEYRIPLEVHEGQATTLLVPGETIWRQWTSASSTFTEVYAADVVWQRWGGWGTTNTVTGSPLVNPNPNTRVVDVQSNAQTAGTQVTYQTNVWQSWITAGTTTMTAPYTVQGAETWGRWNNQWNETEAHRIAREEQQLQHEAERRVWLDEQQRRREAESRRRLALQPIIDNAENRAQELLRMILTPEQLVQYEASGDVTVRGSDGGLFVVQTQYYGRSVHGNIYETDEHGCQLARVCVAPRMTGEIEGLRYSLPITDGHIGQILSIQHDEAGFRTAGNWSDWRRCQHPNVPILGDPTLRVA